MINFPPAAVLFLGAVLLLIIPRRIRPLAFLTFPVLTFCWLLQLSTGDTLTVTFLNFNLVPTRVDSLSLVFGYVFVIITFLGGIFSYHIKDTAERVSTLLYSGSALGVVFAGDLFTLVVFWEIMAVASVYLIWARGTPLSRGAGMRYLMVHLFGGSVLVAGVLLQVTQTGSVGFNHLNDSLAAYLILFAFCLNAAVPPLHAWLSDAYPEGTVTGSVFLSAFTTKTAVYVLARGFAGWEILIWAGVAMAIYGVIYAVLENDARRLLAYHIISQVGYMVAGVGIGTLVAIDGVTAHAFTHILYKALLFMGAGTVLYATGRSKLSELGGLAKAMPWVFALYMIGAFSISGVPLFSGFVSKSLIVYAAGISGLGLVVLLLNLASVGTFLHTGLKLPYFTWLGKSDPDNPIPKPKAIPKGMYIGMGLTAAICITIGVNPSLLYNILPYPVEYQPYTSVHIMETVQILIFTGIGFWLLVKILKPQALISLDTDWFYRRPANLVYNVFVVAVSRFFDGVERVAVIWVQVLVRVGSNPIKYLGGLKVFNPGGEQGKHNTAAEFDPDDQRLPVEPMVVIVILLSVIMLVWGLTRI
jgi:multicomponent Na+:H+ antiporter subunit D